VTSLAAALSSLAARLQPIRARSYSEAVGHYAPRDECPELAPNRRRPCPFCRAACVVRVAGDRAFWACPRFPACRGTIDADQQRWLRYRCGG